MPKRSNDPIDQIQRFCAYQERSIKEVLIKLRALNYPEEGWDEVIEQLQVEGYLDEQRFANSYARGKFRIKNWGRLLIVQGLREKGIEVGAIDEALASQIDEDEYQAALIRLVERFERPQNREERIKIQLSLLRKGFERELIDQAVKEVFENQ